MSKKQKRKTSVLMVMVCYIGLILYITLLSREPLEKRQYNFHLFWSYQRFFDEVHPLAPQTVLNILLFVPYGVLVTHLVQNRKRNNMILTSAIAACLLSVIIEGLQLYFKLGFAEPDDVFHNTLGAIIGTAIVIRINGGEKEMYAKYFKRFLDFILSLCAVIVLSPLFLILIILGSIFMGGNPFFTQERPGKNEKIFKLIKFRSMDNRKDNDGNLLSDDVRLNKYGRFLRASSLDELPELLNILKGDMSIIGPRPLLVQYLDRYNKEQHHRHDVRPGLTGYAQAHGRNGVSWEDKFAMDVWYTKHITFLGDVRIIWDTVMTVVRRDGISSETSATMEVFQGTPEGVASTWREPY